MKKIFSKRIKLPEVMKICAVQGMITMLLCGMALAHNNFAQVLDRKVTLDLKAVSLEEALEAIESVADVKFFYSVDQLEFKDRISVEAKERSLGDILDQLFTPYHIRYKVHEKKAAITLKKEREPDPQIKHGDAEKVASRAGFSLATITGKVTDGATQQPMPGVNIIVKGTTEGTSTDSEGNFSIWAEDKDVLVFSFIGYSTVETLVGGRTRIDVQMLEEVAALEEVTINAGYYDVKAKEKTGNIAKISAKEIEKQPVQNPLAALQGRVAGLEIIQSSGVPGGNFKVRIRGTNSIANGNNPLFIVDGIPYTSTTMSFNETSGGVLGNSLDVSGLGGSSPLNYINPADIESIEVLKDADATAIYGSRGSNGVILITTRKGQIGKTKVDVTFYSGAGKTSGRLDQLNTQQYVAMRKEAFINDNVIPTAANARDLLVWDTTRYTDWQEELIGGTMHTTNTQLSISGGEKNTFFSFGMGYHKETTVFPGDNSDQRISSHLSITNIAPNEKLRTTVTVNYTINSTDLLSQDLTYKAISLSPNAPAVYDEEGDLNWMGWDSSGPLENPLAYLKRPYEATTDALTGNVELAYSLLPNIEIKSRFGFTNNTMDAVKTVPISSLATSVASSALNATNFSNSTFRNWMVEPHVNWRPKLGNGQLDVLVGTQFLDQTMEGLAQTATGFSSEALMKNIAAAPNRTLGTNYFAEYRYHAVFGRVNYNYKSKFIVNVTGRRDGSSRFGPGKQFANFGAVGAAWIFSGERFIKDAISFLSFGKLRGSFGISGNDQLTDYEYLDAYTSSPGVYQGVIGLRPVRLSNPDFAWETNKKIEAALDLGFIEDRILTSVSFYQNRSSNQLVGNPLPPTTGFSSIQANFPATVENAGVEIELNTVNLRREEFTWTTSLNISVPRNELVEFPDLEDSPSYANRYVVGEPLNIVKLFHYIGVDQTTGLYQFEKLDEDDFLDAEDAQTIAVIGPAFFGGVQNSISYRGFELDFHWQFVKQDGRDYTFIKEMPGSMTNQPAFVLDRWRNPGDDADRQLFSQNYPASQAFFNLKFSDRGMSDASFLRLKNVALSYGMPSHWLQKMHMNQARLFLQAQNLVTISNYDGLDPETQGLFLPPLKVLTAGISLTF